MLKIYTIDENCVLFTKDILKLSTEKMDSFTKNLQEIKIKMEVSENECNNFEKKIRSDTSDIKDLMQNFEQFNHAQHCKQFTMTTPSTREDINSESETVSTETTSEQDPDEINVLSEKQRHLQFWN